VKRFFGEGRGFMMNGREWAGACVTKEELAN
jgi:hypothetical protein